MLLERCWRNLKNVRYVDEVADKTADEILCKFFFDDFQFSLDVPLTTRRALGTFRDFVYNATLTPCASTLI